MDKKYKRKNPATATSITWSLEELTALVGDENSHVRLVNAKRHIALHPCQLANLKQSFRDILGNLINFYDDKLNGLFLSYKNPKLLSKNAALLYDSVSCHVDIEADFYVFRPKVGSILKGVINKKATNHLGVLVHKAFNVSIPKKEGEEEDWPGHFLNAGDDATFTVELMDLKPGKGKLPFIRGKLVPSDDIAETPATAKPKIHRFTDQDVDSIEANSDDDLNDNGEISRIDVKKPKFSSTVNEGNSSDSEETEEVSLGGNSRNTQANATVTKKSIKSSDDTEDSSESDDSEPTPSVSRKKPLSVQNQKTTNTEESSDDSDDDTTLLKIPEKSAKSPKKNAGNSFKGKIKLVSSDDSDEEPILNKSIKKKTTKVSPIKNLQRDSDSSDDDLPIPTKPIKKSSQKSRKKSANRRQDSDDLHSDVPISDKSPTSSKPREPVKIKPALRNSVDSDDETPVCTPTSAKLAKNSPKKPKSGLISNDSLANQPLKKSAEKNRKRAKTSDDSEDEDSTLNNFKNTPSIKGDGGKIGNGKTASSDDSEDDTPMVNKSPKKSPKKSSKHLSQELKSSENNSPSFDKSIKQRPKKHKKSKRNSAVDDDSVDPETPENSFAERTNKIVSPQKPLQKKKSKRAHDISSSDESSPEKTNIANRIIKVERESSTEPSDRPSSTVNLPSKTSTNIQLSPGTDSDSDFESFMQVRKIEPENDQETPKTKRPETPKSTSNDQAEASSSRNSTSLKSKKAPANAEDSIQMILHAESVRPEQAREVHIEDESIEVPRRIKKEKKKSKKLETEAQGELDPGTVVRIKKEKDRYGATAAEPKRVPGLQVEVDGEPELENASPTPDVKKGKKKKRDKESRNPKSDDPREFGAPEETPSTTNMYPPSAEPKKSKKSKPKTADETGELSDTSTRSRILVKKEESVFFTNIKIKHEPYASDVESVSSRKRKRQDSERNDTFEDVRIKRESSVARSDEKMKKKKDRSLNGSIKSEANASDLDDAPPRKKSKKKFSE